MSRCMICEKPTTSHKIETMFVCHTCWENNSEAVTDLRNIIKAPKYLKSKVYEINNENDIYTWLIECNELLDKALDMDESADIYRKIYWPSFEAISLKFNKYIKTMDWSFLLKLIDEFEPENDELLIHSHIENAVGKKIIYTRINKGVEDIPIEALDYLGSFYNMEDTEWEESFTFGWGFDHPKLNFYEKIIEAIDDDMAIWVSAVLERAFFADQKKAVPIFLELINDDTYDEETKFELIQAVTSLEEDFVYDIPRYWNWLREINLDLEWNPEVKKQIRATFEEEIPEILYGLPNNWTFEDLQM